MTIVHPDAIDGIVLKGGAHRSPDAGMCLLEAVAYIAGETHSDHPDCVCPVLAAFGRAWNDLLDDEARNRILKPFLPRLVGTRSTPEVQDARAFMAADWAVRTFTPAWLRKAGLDDDAAALEALAVLSSVELCRAARPVIGRARASASAAWDAAWDAAWAAARAALADTVTELQASAADLYTRMIEVA